jgi:predicted ATPase
MSQGKSPLILLQQPELHLHPKMQAHLADLLVQETASTKNSKQRNQPIVVLETHSENLILRVQKLIRTGLLDSNDVAVLFVDRVSADKTGPRSSKKGNQVQVLDLDKYGEFKTDWPLSFSELRLDEIF